MLKCLFSFVIIICSAHANAQLAVIGDSACTGAVANPRLSMKSALPKVATTLGRTLVGLMTNNLGESTLALTLPGILNTFPTNLADVPFTSEFNLQWEKAKDGSFFLSPINRIQPHKTTEEYYGEQASYLVDSPEYSWGNFVGSKLGFRSDDIFLFALDGRRVDDAVSQVERLRQRFKNHLPEKIFFLFVANDICNTDIFNEKEDSKIALAYFEKYKGHLTKALNALMDVPPHPQGTSVYVVASLNAPNLLTTPALLNKSVPWPDGSITCRDMRKRTAPSGSGRSAKFLFEKLKGMCNAVLGTPIESDGSLGPEGGERLHRLDLLMRTHVSAQENSVNSMNKIAKPGFSFQFIPQTYDIEFGPDDISNDCFHPSAQGHAKIARTILQAIQN